MDPQALGPMIGPPLAGEGDGGNDMKVGNAGMCDRCAGFFGDKAVIVHLLRRSRPTKKKMPNDDDDSMDGNVYSSIKEVESRTKLIAPIAPITQ